MKTFTAFVMLGLSICVLAQDQKQERKPATLKGILLEELKEHP